MLSPAPRRAAFSALTTIAVTAALAGCGGETSAGGSVSGAAPASTDAATLLKAAFTTTPGTPTKGSVEIALKGSVDLPKDKDIKHLSGSANLGVSIDTQQAGKPLPPLAVTFAVDGDYTDGSGKSGKGKYSGGLSYVGDQLYANWEGKDYAVGEELTKQALAALQAEEQKQGVSATSPLGGVDPQKLINAMDLSPDTWFKSTTVTDGGTIDGVDTQKVSGAVDVKAVADDVTDGLKALPAAVPELPGVDQLKDVGSISSADLAEAEKSIKVLNAAIWVGKQDHREHQVQLEIQVDDQTGSSPGTANLTLTITNSSTPKPITAPKAPDPITDLFFKIEKEFHLGGGSGGGGGLGGLFA